MSSFEFKRESLIETWDEAQDLFKKNALETSLFPERFSPIKESYEQLNSAGTLFFFTMRKDKRLVGYAIYFAAYHLHFQTIPWALQDALFVTPECRGVPAIRFLKWMDEELKSLGVEVVSRQVSKNKDYGRVLLHMGYAPVEQTFVRRL